MPELPEVETVVRGLQAALPGRSIISVRLGKTDFIDDPVAIGESLPGRSIAAVGRIGKFIHVQLAPEAPSDSVRSEAPSHLLVHLGMTGRLVVRGWRVIAPPHTRMSISSSTTAASCVTPTFAASAKCCFCATRKSPNCANAWVTTR